MKNIRSAADLSQGFIRHIEMMAFAQAHHDHTRQEVNSVYSAVLAERHYFADPALCDEGSPPERITDPKHSYLLTDDDFKHYLETSIARIADLGYKVERQIDSYRDPAELARRLFLKTQREAITFCAKELKMFEGPDEDDLILRLTTTTKKADAASDLFLKMAAPRLRPAKEIVADVLTAELLKAYADSAPSK